jgi:hypothetical protein
MAPADPPLTTPAHRFGLLIEEFERGLVEGIRRDQAALGPLALLLLAYLGRMLRGLGALYTRGETQGPAAPGAEAAAGEAESPSDWTGADAVPGASPRQPVAAHAGAAGDAGAAAARPSGRPAAPAALANDGPPGAIQGAAGMIEAAAPHLANPILRPSPEPRLPRPAPRSAAPTPPNRPRRRPWRVDPGTPAIRAAPAFSGLTGQRLLAS